MQTPVEKIVVSMVNLYKYVKEIMKYLKLLYLGKETFLISMEFARTFIMLNKMNNLFRPILCLLKEFIRNSIFFYLLVTM